MNRSRTRRDLLESKRAIALHRGELRAETHEALGWDRVRTCRRALDRRDGSSTSSAFAFAVRSTAMRSIVGPAASANALS
jgi:hypothetical protein